MPSGPPELHEKWGDDASAMRFLKVRGWKLLRSWEWVKPSKAHVITEEEHQALDYLILEWDFGTGVHDPE